MLRSCSGKVCYVYATEVVAGEDGLQVVGHGCWWLESRSLREVVVDVGICVFEVYAR